CSPFEPEVFGKLCSPKWLKISRTQSPTWAHCTMFAGGPGSRSKTIMVGVAMLEANESDGCGSIDARFAIHTSVGKSLARMKWIVRWLLSLQTGAVFTQSGRCMGAFFSKRYSWSAPSG